MKKLLFFVIFAFFFAGCGSSGLAPDETLTSDYAYVVGKLAHNRNSGSYEFKDARYVDSFSSPTGSSFKLYLESDDRIQKVNPGRYAAIYRAYNAMLGADAVLLGTFVLEAGKINYIGSFDIRASTISSNMKVKLLRISPNITYQPEAVKEALKITYPSLAQDIDTKFVVKPLR